MNLELIVLYRAGNHSGDEIVDPQLGGRRAASGFGIGAEKQNQCNRQEEFFAVDGDIEVSEGQNRRVVLLGQRSRSEQNGQRYQQRKNAGQSLLHSDAPSLVQTRNHAPVVMIIIRERTNNVKRKLKSRR